MQSFLKQNVMYFLTNFVSNKKKSQNCCKEYNWVGIPTQTYTGHSYTTTILRNLNIMSPSELYSSILNLEKTLIFLTC